MNKTRRFKLGSGGGKGIRTPDPLLAKQPKRRSSDSKNSRFLVLNPRRLGVNLESVRPLYAQSLSTVQEEEE